jgi:antitoxin ParD1/3/4
LNNNKDCYILLFVPSSAWVVLMNISLTPHLENLVKSKVDSGLYNSASEVMRDALRLLEERDYVREMRLTELRREIQIGIDSGDPTPLDMEEIKAAGRARRAARQQKGE